MNKLICIFAILFFSIFSFADNQSLEKMKDELRQELIIEMDAKLKDLRQELMSKIDERLAGVKQQGYLGISLKEISDGLRTLLDLEGNQGVLVTEVEANGPASKAGIAKMDIILSFAGKRVATPAKLQKLIADTTPGMAIEIVILSKRQTKSVFVKIGGKLRVQKSQNPLQKLLKNKDQLGGLLEKQMEQMFGHLPKEQKDMMKNMQKKLRKQFENLQKDPDAMREIGKSLKDLLGDLNPNQEKEEIEEEENEDEEIDDLLNDLMEKSTNAGLGLVLIPIPEPLKQKEGYGHDYGALISKVDGAAADAGIQKWEILMSVGDVKITSSKIGNKIISELESEQKVTLKIYSQGKIRNVVVELK